MVGRDRCWLGFFDVEVWVLLTLFYIAADVGRVFFLGLDKGLVVLFAAAAAAVDTMFSFRYGHDGGREMEASIMSDIREMSLMCFLFLFFLSCGLRCL